jgi:hypothetical protein
MCSQFARRCGAIVASRATVNDARVYELRRLKRRNSMAELTGLGRE